MEEKIRFKNLSVPLKIAVVSSYIVGGFWGLLFLIGIIEGMMLV